MRAVYRDQTLVTKVGMLHADHARPGDRLTGLPTSSSTSPSLVIRMLRHGQIHDGADVLAWPPGPYSAALLSTRRRRHFMSTTVEPARVSFLELEVTRRCPLQCLHCYSDSGPAASHGTMTTLAWEKVITDAATLGVEVIQFIGGEPTMHPGFERLLGHAVGAGLRVEVFTNLVRVKDAWWELFTHQGVCHWPPATTATLPQVTRP